ncbi:hypothetical protein BJ944DRAFT_269952 [Cunninghamella echinulata]|nr:hypothetical protein BJ944DRAFT_269952 [Cunninghamella echinulata]
MNKLIILLLCIVLIHQVAAFQCFAGDCSSKRCEECCVQANSRRTTWQCSSCGGWLSRECHCRPDGQC